MRNIFLLCVFICTSIALSAQEYNQFDADGKRHGKWRKRYDNSDQIRYEGTFDHGKEVGKFKFYKPSGGKSPTAIKIFSKESDTVLVRYLSVKGKVISEGKMVLKARIGLWKYFHNGSDKIMMTEKYVDGKLDGEQLTYFDNGQLTEKTQYLAGKRHGKRVIYSEKGIMLKEYTYENGQLHGLTKYYDTEGNLIIEGKYKRDRKDSIWNYYTNGKITERKLFPLEKRG
ncbi:hypothetical protein M0D21_11100 [Aquimarina sp. D1M17]|uniref:toxin-antitoxin system YwqK family antitoxin n=1 Tax=Aquimarina acroporae TaxID=2937283 RepID=UPI0020C0EC28|nr:hypothetical protein [Aquimarina acroporae]MCK8522119.1 hypothetical protein [Aquimarina acroporae]